MSGTEKFKEKLPSKKSFIVCWQVKKISDKESEHVLREQDDFKIKTMKDYHRYAKKDILLLNDVF